MASFWGRTIRYRFGNAPITGLTTMLKKATSPFTEYGLTESGDLGGYYYHIAMPDGTYNLLVEGEDTVYQNIVINNSLIP